MCVVEGQGLQRAVSGAGVRRVAAPRMRGWQGPCSPGEEWLQEESAVGSQERGVEKLGMEAGLLPRESLLGQAGALCWGFPVALAEVSNEPFTVCPTEAAV